MTIYIGADHAGFKLKEFIKAYLGKKGHRVIDKGAFTYNNDDDYPDFTRSVAESVRDNPESRGIVLGGSGQGEAIAANRFTGIRAAVFYGGREEIVKLSRVHNDANILSLGARFLAEDEALKAVEIWLETSFSGGRHNRRIRKIDAT